jgi:hypothetical protein
MYGQNDWGDYDLYQDMHDYRIDEKIGVVKLDLSQYEYTGIPPDFSSTHSEGTEIYSIKGVKKEYAVIIKEYGVKQVLYRLSKADQRSQETDPKDLKALIANFGEDNRIYGVEFRSAYDGSWMKTISDDKLLSLINEMILELPLYSTEETKSSYTKGSIPINLLFDDSKTLTMHIYSDYGLVQNLYIDLPEAFVQLIRDYSKEGEIYNRITDLLSYEEEDAAYFAYKNEDGLHEMSNPKWTISAFYLEFGYYRVEEVSQERDLRLIFSFYIGLDAKQNEIIDFYEDSQGLVLLKKDNKFYKILKGEISTFDLEDFVRNFTSL